MSVKKGTTNISKIKKGAVGISKVYKGTNLVFEEEKPLWLIIGSAWWISEDGGNYTKIEGSPGGGYDGLICYRGNFYTAYSPAGGSGQNYLRKYPIENIRQGNRTSTQTTPFTDNSSDSPVSLATDGQSVIVVTLNGKNTLCYSFDGGDTWENVSAGSSNTILQYIGGGLFLYAKKISDRGGAANGKYYYWNKNKPTTYYSSTYKLPDESYPRNGEAEWLNNMWYCNGIYYVSTTDGVYYGTRNQAEGKLSVDGLSSFVYCYGRYYAIKKGSEYTTLYYSTDGKTFTERKYNGKDFFYRDRGRNIKSLERNNGKLCFYGPYSSAGSGMGGYIDKNFNIVNTSGTYAYNHACNKYPKI